MTTAPGPIERHRQSDLAHGRDDPAPGTLGGSGRGASGHAMGGQTTGQFVQRFIGQLPQSPGGPKPGGSAGTTSGPGASARTKPSPSRGPELAEALDDASEALAAHQLAQWQRRGLLHPEVF